MISVALLPGTATRLRPATTTDPYGNTVDDWVAATSATIRCRVQQDTRSEQVDETGDRLVSRWTLYTNDEVAAGDRVVYGGMTFEVDGRPYPVIAAVGVHHYKVTLRVVEG